MPYVYVCVYIYIYLHTYMDIYVYVHYIGICYKYKWINKDIHKTMNVDIYTLFLLKPEAKPSHT